MNYDLEYALRLCSEHDLKPACVHIYSTMGLYEEAVDLALLVSTVLLRVDNLIHSTAFIHCFKPACVKLFAFRKSFIHGVLLSYATHFIAFFSLFAKL